MTPRRHDEADVSVDPRYSVRVIHAPVLSDAFEIDPIIRLAEGRKDQNVVAVTRKVPLGGEGGNKITSHRCIPRVVPASSGILRLLPRLRTRRG